MTTKTCKKCGTTRENRDCNNCRKISRLLNRDEYLEKRRKYAADHREKINEAARKYREKNIEVAREKSRQWRLNNKERVKEYNAKYNTENSEKVAALSLRWKSKNKDKVVESNARNYALNKEKSLNANKEWRRANQDAMRIHHLNRRVRVRTTGKLSAGLFDKLFALQNGKCACCRVSLLKAKAHMDHIFPIALGGLNVDENMQLLCRQCNQSKHAKHPIDFMQSRGFLL